MLEVPDPVVPVSIDMLEQLAAEAPDAQRTSATAAAMKMFEFDVEAWMAKVGVGVEKGPAAYRGGRRWTLAACPFDSSHTGGSAAIFESKDGVLRFKCQHNGCNGKGWKDVRRHLDPEYVAQEQWQVERKQDERERRKQRRQARAKATEKLIEQAADNAINFTDLGNARRLVAHFGSDFRYCHESGDTLLWSEVRWQKDVTGGMELLAKRTVGEMYRAAANLSSDERQLLVAHACRQRIQNRNQFHGDPGSQRARHPSPAVAARLRPVAAQLPQWRRRSHHGRVAPAPPRRPAH